MRSYGQTYDGLETGTDMQSVLDHNSPSRFLGLTRCVPLYQKSTRSLGSQRRLRGKIKRTERGVRDVFDCVIRRQKRRLIREGVWEERN